VLLRAKKPVSKAPDASQQCRKNQGRKVERRLTVRSLALFAVQRPAACRFLGRSDASGGRERAGKPVAWLREGGFGLYPSLRVWVCVLLEEKVAFSLGLKISQHG